MCCVDRTSSEINNFIIIIIIIYVNVDNHVQKKKNKQKSVKKSRPQYEFLNQIKPC